jgi:hypothetical protein
MLPYDHLRWEELYDACHALYDPRDALRKLEQGTPWRKQIWDELFQKLQHQGEVDIASYVVVPELARIIREKSIVDWEPFALIASIEDCRRTDGNPPLPPWLERDYLSALRECARYGCSLSDRPWSRELARAVLSVLAFANDLSAYGKLLIDFTDDELSDLLDEYSTRE